MDASRRIWPRADLRVGDADREAVVSELQRHYIEGRLNSDELGERVTQALQARTFGDLAALLTDLPPLHDAVPALPQRGSAQHGDWQSSTWFPPSIGMLLLIVGLITFVAIIAMPGMRFGFFPWPLLIWGFFFFGRPYRGRRF
ncbi:MAG: DUF1707 domain-containing protein [Chloroflexi bacterium]|nr:DUF1707 domain-containing protein [Chloroflexota bacterium]MBV9133414.1 DUF1707 domain-containing protein [Chloroflexota bacterium]MBV9894599.1 DUF1707 domain-containing protein [Chloroflexota bacterium]